MMIKKLIGLALASTATLALANCGSPDPVAMDTTTMSDGTSNKTGLGGYWWTYVDRTTNGLSSVTPNTGKIEPNNPTSTALNKSLARGNGIDDGGSGNMALHVTGAVQPEPKWTATLGTAVQADGSDWQDTYWNVPYGSLCVGGLCGETKYPSAGIGMGFKKGNAPLGTDATGKVGIAFKLKTTAAGHSPISVSLPMDLTDVPDASFNDEFGTAYAGGILASGAATPPTNSPFCSFPGSKMADGVTPNGKDKTCFANLMVTIAAPTATWTTYCAAFSSFAHPAWATAALKAAGISKGFLNDKGESLVPRIIKLQFDAYKPLAAETAPVPFDFWIDDVMLLDAETAGTVCGAPGVVAL